jgi:hypothetical protein
MREEEVPKTNPLKPANLLEPEITQTSRERAPNFEPARF